MAKLRASEDPPSISRDSCSENCDKRFSNLVTSVFAREKQRLFLFLRWFFGPFVFSSTQTGKGVSSEKSLAEFVASHDSNCSRMSHRSLISHHGGTRSQSRTSFPRFPSTIDEESKSWQVNAVEDSEFSTMPSKQT